MTDRDYETEAGDLRVQLLAHATRVGRLSAAASMAADYLEILRALHPELVDGSAEEFARRVLAEPVDYARAVAELAGRTA